MSNVRTSHTTDFITVKAGDRAVAELKSREFDLPVNEEETDDENDIEVRSVNNCSREDDLAKLIEKRKQLIDKRKQIEKQIDKHIKQLKKQRQAKEPVKISVESPLPFFNVENKADHGEINYLIPDNNASLFPFLKVPTRPKIKKFDHPKHESELPDIRKPSDVSERVGRPTLRGTIEY